ncbi:acyltransferase [soil metagenome]
MNYDDIFSISSFKEFEVISLEVFRHQYYNNEVYRQFCRHLNIKQEQVTHLKAIPFLPIDLFKSHKIISGNEEHQTIFTSSGSTGMVTSKHFVTDMSLYEKSFLTAFNKFYGNPKEWIILALLPSYLEREGSSLIYMANRLIEESVHPSSGFYLNNHEELAMALRQSENKGRKTLLIGVSFALLDLLEKHKFNRLEKTIIMETGGMKGRRREMIREELHEILTEGFNVKSIHSEYGMTELLSQAYSKGDGVFECPSWMKIFIRDPEDALTYLPEGKTGGINIIDLANVNSCSFISTQDLGKDLGNGKTSILGRFDHSDIRGCNLMVV